MKIAAYIKKRLTAGVADLKDRLKKNRKALRLCSVKKWRYKVSIYSCWKDYGEKDIDFVAKEGVSLRKAVLGAEKKFLRVNPRSDIQADYSACILGGDCIVGVDDKAFKKYKEHYRRKR